MFLSLQVALIGWAAAISLGLLIMMQQLFRRGQENGIIHALMNSRFDALQKEVNTLRGVNSALQRQLDASGLMTAQTEALRLVLGDELRKLWGEHGLTGTPQTLLRRDEG